MTANQYLVSGVAEEEGLTPNRIGQHCQQAIDYCRSCQEKRPEEERLFWVDAGVFFKTYREEGPEAILPLLRGWGVIENGFLVIPKRWRLIQKSPELMDGSDSELVALSWGGYRALLNGLRFPPFSGYPIITTSFTNPVRQGLKESQASASCLTGLGEYEAYHLTSSTNQPVFGINMAWSPRMGSMDQIKQLSAYDQDHEETRTIDFSQYSPGLAYLIKRDFTQGVPFIPNGSVVAGINFGLHHMTFEGRIRTLKEMWRIAALTKNGGRAIVIAEAWGTEEAARIIIQTNARIPAVITMWDALLSYIWGRDVVQEMPKLIEAAGLAGKINPEPRLVPPGLQIGVNIIAPLQAIFTGW